MERTGKFVIIVTVISSFIANILIHGVVLGVPAIGSSLGMNNVNQNWILTVYSLFSCIFTIPAGQISSKYGCKKALLIGICLFLIGLIIPCFINSGDLFLMSRAIQGIGVSFCNVSTIAIIILAITKENRGRSFGIVVASPFLGACVSPALCGYLINNFGWKSIFYLTIPFVALSILLVIFKIDKEWKTHENDDLDKIGIILSMIGLLLFVYGFTNVLSFTGQISITIGTIILVIFGIYEFKNKTPVFNVRLFKNKTFAAYCTSAFLCLFAIAVADTIFNYYFQYIQGWDSQITGLTLMISPVVLLITTPIAGRLSDKFHPQKIVTVGFAVILSSFIILSSINMNTPTYMIILALILESIGFGLFTAPNMNAISSAVPNKYASYVSSIQITMRSIGQTLSLSLLTLLFSFFMGHLELSTKYADIIAHTLGIICSISVLLCIGAIIISLIGLKSDKAI